MSTHNICFHGEVRKKFNTVGLYKAPYRELMVYSLDSLSKAIPINAWAESYIN